MSFDIQRECRDPAIGRIGDLRREAAVDQPRRQMPAQVDDGRSGQPLDELRQPRTDTGQ
jgi:hypothetical protein